MKSEDKNKIKRHLNKKNILTVPNLLSCIRLLLIPVIIILYVNKKDLAALIVIGVSAVTDLADGFIARRFNMISDLGKILDPIADKLTQGCICLCLALKFPAMWFLIAAFVIKEVTMLIMGYVLFHLTEKVPYAKWYGKACSAFTVATIMLLILWANIPITVANILILVCTATIVISFIMYMVYYYKILSPVIKEKKKK